MKLLNALLNEETQGQQKRFKLKDLTYEKVKGILGTGFSAPYASDKLRQINNEHDWEDWKEEILKDYSDVEIVLDPYAEWYNRIKVVSNKFIADKKARTDSKAAYIDAVRKAGGSTD